MGQFFLERLSELSEKKCFQVSCVSESQPMQGEKIECLKVWPSDKMIRRIITLARVHKGHLMSRRHEIGDRTMVERWACPAQRQKKNHFALIRCAASFGDRHKKWDFAAQYPAVMVLVGCLVVSNFSPSPHNAYASFRSCAKTLQSSPSPPWTALSLYYKVS
jgi:hypothetical protein